VYERQALAQAFNAGVSEDGLKLFLNLSKTIGRDVSWKGIDIIVNSTVLIKSPYRTEDCCLANETARNEKMIGYVQQLVSRFWADAVSKPSSRSSPEKQVPQASTSDATTPSAPTAASVVAGTSNKVPPKQQANGSGEAVKEVKLTAALVVASGVSSGQSPSSGTQGKKTSRNGS